MKNQIKSLLLIPFFALLLFVSCQEEKIEISETNESEALVAESELTTLISATSKMDGSKDNIIDQASCLSIELPITVVVKGLEIIIDSEEDFDTIEALFDEFEDDEDTLDIIFPITIVLSDHEEVIITSRLAMDELIADCNGENEEDDDIECIDFQFPVTFSVYNREFQVVNVVTIESDRELHRFVKRVRNAEVSASLNFPVTMVLADGTEVIVNDNEELRSTIKEAKNACDEDDDNDHNDDDFTKERLDEYLKICPWVVFDFKRNNLDNTTTYVEYALNFKEEGVVVMRSRSGDLLTGTWSTRVSDRGALLKMNFDNLADFTLEWLVYDIAPGKIKVHEVGGNRIIMKKNCDVIVDHTKERVEGFLQECLWRIDELSVNGANSSVDYIGTPLKFFENNVVKLRVNGELIEGTYEILVRNAGIGLKINLDGRPNLKLVWLITFLENDLIKLSNINNKMVLKRHCPRTDNDIDYVEGVIIDGSWEVTKYDDGLIHVQDPTENFRMYTLNFLESGRIKITDPNEGVSSGAWLAYRNEGLFLGMKFGQEAPFNQLSYRWVIKEISPNRIELKDLSATGAIERILVLKKKND